MIDALIGQTGCADFILQLTSPRQLTTKQVLDGDPDKLAAMKQGLISPEDILWALSGALEVLRDLNAASKSEIKGDDLEILANILKFTGYFTGGYANIVFYLLIKQCAVFTRIPSALKLLKDKDMAFKLNSRFEKILEEK